MYIVSSKIVVNLLPYNKTAMVGGTVKFYCDLNTETKKNWKKNNWTFNDGALPTNVDILGPLEQHIQIKNIQIDNVGIYKCTTSTQYGYEVVAEGQLVVVCEF